MIIQCPYCNTRFQLDDSRLAGPHPMLKCSRCRHIFPGPNSSPSGAPKSSPPPKAENLSFTFSEPGAKEPSRPAPDFIIDEAEPEYELGTEPAPTARREAPADEPAPDIADDGFPTDDAAPPSVAPVARSPRSVPDDDLEPFEAHPAAFDEPESQADFADEFQPQATEEARAMPREISVRPVLIFLGLVVAAYGVVAWTLRANAALADSLLRKLPFISSLTEDRLLNRKIVLSEVTGSYQRIKDGQSVFVITGRALNNAPVTVHDVQIVGRLFNGANTQVDEKMIFCGNVISMKILKSLTQREVSIFQDLKPPKRFGIAPGEDSTFVIVFMQPPNGVTEYSTQVMAAQRQA